MGDSHSIANLHQQLDTLWIRYLDLLDQYTQAQHNIKTSLSQGFLSLAQANFTSSGRRYGQDHYDQRAVASSKVEITNDASMFSVKINIQANPGMKAGAAHLATPVSEDGKDEPKLETSANQLPTPEPEETSEGSPEESPEQEQPRMPSDPLRQFGILIPTALRSAQRSFTKAVRDEDALTQAINSSKQMREVEVEIRKARKVLKRAERDAVGALEA